MASPSGSGTSNGGPAFTAPGQHVNNLTTARPSVSFAQGLQGTRVNPQNGYPSSHNSPSISAGDVRPRRNLDWESIGQGRRNAGLQLAPQKMQPPSTRSADMPMAVPYSHNPYNYPSGYSVNGSSNNAFSNPAPALNFLPTSYAGQIHHETPYGQYMPAVQHGIGQGDQSYLPGQDIGVAGNAESSALDRSLEDPFAGIFDLPDVTSPAPAFVGQSVQNEPAIAGPGFDVDSGSASLNPSTLPAQSELAGGRLNVEGFGPPLVTPAENAFAQDVNPQLLVDILGADLSAAIQAALSKRDPFHKLFAGDDPLSWAKSAFQIGLAPPPRQCSFNIEGRLFDFWLPSQEDFATWNATDISQLMQRCNELRIEVNWQALDSYGFQVRPLMGSVQTGHGYENQPAAQNPSPLGQVQVPTGHAGPSHGFRAPIPQPSQPQAQYPIFQQPRMMQNTQQPARVPSLNDGVGQAEHPQEIPELGLQGQPAAQPPNFASVAQPQPLQPTFALQQQNVRKPRKRKPHDASAMLQPSVGAVIELPTTDDRRQHQRDLEMDWWNPTVDNSAIPETDEDQRPYVKILKEAMMDTSQAKDSVGSNTPFTKRWSAAALAKNGFPRSTTEMEATCWDLVEMAVKLHKDGPGFLKVHDQRLQNKLEAEQDLTFEQRIDTMVTVMLLSKARVDKLLKHENLGSFVGHPMDILKSTKGNRAHNIKRKDQNQKGKLAQEKEKELAAAAAAAAAGSDATSAVVGSAEAGEGGEEEVEEELEEEFGEEEAKEDEDEERDGEKSPEGDDSDGDNNDSDDNDDEDDDESGGMAAGNSAAVTSNEIDSQEASPTESHDDAGDSSGTSQRLPSSARSNRASSDTSLRRDGLGMPPNTTSFLGQRASSSSRRPRPAPRPAIPRNAPLAPSGGSRKRPATLHHGLDLPSPSKRSRGASYTGSDNEPIYDEPRASPGASPPGKRRASEAELEDTNTRQKSARTVDRQIIAPKRARRPQ
ncbi:hypothetical protein EKO04_011441 [Ascochyta lentis]|uniref:Uncharacterized protein n=1 Tax=Ascochyta lentis TaxID=205686 RepID=A0A8H7ISN8_9PLEO|nr:hypothetical protein EKO04_011441 [Ascochyta lentis]